MPFGFRRLEYKNFYGNINAIRILVQLSSSDQQSHLILSTLIRLMMPFEYGPPRGGADADLKHRGVSNRKERSLESSPFWSPQTSNNSTLKTLSTHDECVYVTLHLL